MATSNNFSDYYKTISDAELVSILDNQDEYQALAVEAAKQEFINRQLSDAEIQEAKQQLIAKQADQEKKSEKVKAVENKIKIVGHSFIDTINPIQSGIPSTEKTIRLIVIVFGGIFLYQFVSDFGTHLSYLKGFQKFPFESSLYFLPLLVLPIAIFTFWRRKTIGWTLLAIFVTFSIAGALWLLFQSFNWKSHSGFDNLFPRPSPITYIVQLLFLTGILYVLSQTNIRDIFLIGKQRMIATIVITLLVTSFLLFAVS